MDDLEEQEICLKDYYRKCREWGRKPVIPVGDRPLRKTR